MADAATILNSPDFINANEATKKAIFDRHVAKNPDYVNANPETQTAIRQRFGIEFAPGPEEVEVSGRKFTFPDGQTAANFRRSLLGDTSPESMALQYGGKPVVEPIPATRQPAPQITPRSFLAPVASFADVTLGGIAPGAIQQFGYPFLRAGVGAERAAELTQRAASAFEKPFGRALGITETPEYKGEALQRLTQFIGENVDKGAQWLSEKTGLPASDITNMIGNASLLAGPSVAKIPTKLGERQADKLIEASRQSWADLPRIQAAQAAERYGILLNPSESNPTLRNDIRVALAGGQNVSDFMAAKNAPRWTTLAKEDMGLGPNSVLEPKTFEKVRADVAEPYDRMQAMGTMPLDDQFQAALRNINSPQILGGVKSPVVDKMLADVSQVSQINGRDALATIKAQRKVAQDIYKRENTPNPPSVEDRAVADAAMSIANAVEDLVTRNIPDPKYRAELQAARAKMATSYAYELATDFTTGKIDPNVIAKLVRQDPERYTGVIKDIGMIAGSFPDIANIGQPRSKGIPKLARGSASAVTGGLLGAATAAGGLAGVALGGLAGYAGGRLSRAGMATPGFQAARAVPPDNRLRVNMPEESAPVANNLPTVFDWQNAVLDERMLYPDMAGPPQPQPNWTTGEVFGPRTVYNAKTGEESVYYGPRNPVVDDTVRGAPPLDPRFSPPTPAGPQLAYDLSNLSPEQRRAYERARDENVERLNALNPTWGPFSPPTKGGVELSLDPHINRLRPVEPTGAELPPTNELASAVGKIERGERVTLSATEKIAWDKAQADLAIVDPAYRKLSPSDLVNRMADRKWVESTIQKARDKAAAFDEIARRATDARAKQLANANRERMMDFAEELDDRLRVMPTAKIGQGPKTRAAKTLPPVVIKATRLPPEE